MGTASSRNESAARDANPRGSNAARRRGSYTHERPVWVEDERVSACGHCRAEFTFVLRRHHCRACGLIFCGRCTQMHGLDHLGYKGPVRQCVACAEQLMLQADHKMSNLVLPCGSLNTPPPLHDRPTSPTSYADRQYNNKSLSSAYSKEAALTVNFSVSSTSFDDFVVTSSTPSPTALSCSHGTAPYATARAPDRRPAADPGDVLHDSMILRELAAMVAA